MKKKFIFTAGLWLYPGMAGNWTFVSLPKKDGEAIKKSFGKHSRGWGSLRVEVRLGKSKWRTSVFPDKKSGTYILPIKAGIRKCEGIIAGDKTKVSLEII
ncbi:MAG: DUF1905 domain-containing protein [Candidatus Magasanikbacteria bacterium]|nr:DUF1905 domain-containing protein [Candidatus Magasanikbacteria bacterium]